MRIAAISDIHGNLPALEAVLDDIGRRGADLVVQLGDALSGPLWPRETAELLRSRALPCVRGNHDRALLADPAGMGPADAHARRALDDAHLDWLRGWPMTLEAAPDVLLFHATPADDDTYLLEDPSTGYAQLRPVATVQAMLDGIDARLMLCGHTHVPRVLRLPDGRSVVNAGSVGLPAYTDDTGGFHRHENGSPHARYALVDLLPSGMQAAIVAVDYDWDAASRQAARNGRTDWASWLASGRA
jgi:predicted phosphodiesterase